MIENESRWTQVEVGRVHDPIEGNVVIPAIPARFSVTPPNVHRPWPQLGQHTREVLAEAGYSGEEIDEITAAR